MSVFEMAKKYYPRLWGKERIEALVAAGRLTRSKADQIIAAETELEAGGEGDALQ